MEVQEQMLMSSLNKILYAKSRKQAEQEAVKQEVKYPEMPAPRQVEAEATSFENTEKYLIYLLLCYGNNQLFISDDQKTKHQISVAQFIIDELISDEIVLSNPIYQKIFEEYKTQYFNSNEIDERFFINNDDTVIANTTSTLLISNYNLANWEKYKRSVKTEKDNIEENINKTILNLKLKIIESRIQRISKLISDTEGTEDNLIHIHEKRELDKIWFKVRQVLGREK